MTHRVGLIGLGKIARERHAPAIARNPQFELSCVADVNGATLPGVPSYRDHVALLAGTTVDVVAICTPPAPRFAIARDALKAGKHVLLEKPPTATLGELDFLERLAAANGCVLFTAWHSQHNPTVDRAREILASRVVTGLHIDWKEDAATYHSGQTWIWDVGGFGVFDAGINGLSILSRLFGAAIFIRGADLKFAPGKRAPIAADLVLSMGREGGDLLGAFDWRSGQIEQREILIDTAEGGSVELHAGGGRLVVDGSDVMSVARSEYPLIYEKFAELLRAGHSEVDGGPLRMVADAFLVGKRVDLDPAQGCTLKDPEADCIR